LETFVWKNSGENAQTEGSFSDIQHPALPRRDANRLVCLPVILLALLESISSMFMAQSRQKKRLTDLVTIIPAHALVALERLVADFRLNLPTIEAA
jgi:hypothetical protein